MLNLIEQVARDHNRFASIDQSTDLPANDIRVRYWTDAAGRVSFEFLKRERRAVVLTLAVWRA